MSKPTKERVHVEIVSILQQHAAPAVVRRRRSKRRASKKTTRRPSRVARCEPIPRPQVEHVEHVAVVPHNARVDEAVRKPDKSIFGAGVFLGVLLGMLLGNIIGREQGRRSVQREQHEAAGCQRISTEPELWECPDGRREEIK